MDFDRWLQRFVTGLEKTIFRVALAFVVLLFIVQAALLNGNLRTLLSKTDRLEGQPLESAQDVFGGKVNGEGRPAFFQERAEDIKLELALFPPPGEFPELSLLLNNEIVGSWQEDTNLEVHAKPGDLLEVVGKVSGGLPATIEVVAVHGNIKVPEKGHAIQTFGERDLLAWIIP